MKQASGVRRIGSLVVVCLFAVGWPALAEEKTEAEVLLEDAQKAIEARKWDEANEKLKHARAALASLPVAETAQTARPAAARRAEHAIERAQAEVDQGRRHALAAQAWSEYAKKLGKGAQEIDPLGAVRKPAKWKGKTIRIDDFVDQADRGFASADYDLIAVVNGSAVAAKFSPELKEAIKEFEEAGFSIEAIEKISDGVVTLTRAARLESIFATVTGTCRVTVTDEIEGASYSAGIYEAPLVKVIALKQGPIAAAANEPTIAKKLPPP
jgi:hypothetical protein